MRKLYLKPDIEKGQVLGLTDAHGNIRHVGRFYPNRPTTVENDRDAQALLDKYPGSIGDWDEDKEQVEQVIAKRERQKEEEWRALTNRRKQMGPAVQPIHPDPKTAQAIRRGHEAGQRDWEDEKVSEEDLKNEIDLVDGDGQGNPETDLTDGSARTSPNSTQTGDDGEEGNPETDKDAGFEMSSPDSGIDDSNPFLPCASAIASSRWRHPYKAGSHRPPLSTSPAVCPPPWPGPPDRSPRRSAPTRRCRRSPRRPPGNHSRRR